MTTVPLIVPLLDGALDVVGDIHGEIDALRELLAALGYDRQGRHRHGRRLVFVGDLCDRGPDSPSVMEFVARLVDGEQAQCVLGNHELNLLRAARKEGNGWFFEADHDAEEDKFPQSASLLSAADRNAVLDFLATLPLALERRDLRVVHAAWHAPAIEVLRVSAPPVAPLYAHYAQQARREADSAGLDTLAKAALQAYGHPLEDLAHTPPLLHAVGALDAHYQMANPVRIVTSGLERVAARPFKANGRWRMVDRVPWWQEYRDETPVIFGHYWRWPTEELRALYTRAGSDLFESAAAHHWLGPRRNAYCVDFAVGARHAERRRGRSGADFDCRLAAVRWPERQVVFDDGQGAALH